MSADIAKMDALSLNHWFFKFVMEVAKKFGERYPLKTVVCSQDLLVLCNSQINVMFKTVCCCLTVTS